jgi:hypothetical protein
MLEGKSGGLNGDMALDDISFTNSPCENGF